MLTVLIYFYFLTDFLNVLTLAVLQHLSSSIFKWNIVRGKLCMRGFLEGSLTLNRTQIEDRKQHKS